MVIKKHAATVRPCTRDEERLQKIFTGGGGAGDGVELRLHPLEEVHGLVDRSRQLLSVLHQHIAVGLLLIHRLMVMGSWHQLEKKNYAVVVDVGNHRDEP
jgi:hypothetical protein